MLGWKEPGAQGWIVLVKNGGDTLVVTDPKKPAEVVQPEEAPVPDVPNNVPVEPTGQGRSQQVASSDPAMVAEPDVKTPAVHV